MIEALFSKGPDARIPAGTVVGVTVADRVELPAIETRSVSASLTQERLRSQSSQSSPNLFLYASDNERPFRRRIKVDSKPLLKLGSGQWTCSSLTPGEHEIQIDRDLFSLNADEKGRYYLKLLTRDDPRVVLETHGFEIETDVLEFRPSSKGEPRTKCWN